MGKRIAVVTMVSDDYFFLERWLGYYGALFGRPALYVVNLGRDARVAEMAEGCNVIGLDYEFDKRFDMLRWRFLNHLVNGLRSYTDMVIVGDVDELLVVDPDTGLDLGGFLDKRHGKQVLTPIGLELVHREADETDPIGASILGPRRHVRFSSWFCKPCVVSTTVHIARGGHYADQPELKVFRKLYLLHLKYADRGEYDATRARRRGRVSGLEDGEDVKATMLSADWYRSDDELGRLNGLPVTEFDTAPLVDHMQSTWEKRGEHGLYHFERRVDEVLMRLPDRFDGLV